LGWISGQILIFAGYPVPSKSAGYTVWYPAILSDYPAGYLFDYFEQEFKIYIYISIKFCFVPSYFIYKNDISL